MFTVHTRSMCLNLLMRVNLFKHSEKSFTMALDEANIKHGRVQTFSTAPQNSGIVESITAISEAMPWNSLAKVIVAWLEARKSREIIITTKENEVIHAKGYSAKDVEKILNKSVNLAVIDAKPEE